MAKKKETARQKSNRIEDGHAKSGKSMPRKQLIARMKKEEKEKTGKGRVGTSKRKTIKPKHGSK